MYALFWHIFSKIIKTSFIYMTEYFLWYLYTTVLQSYWLYGGRFGPDYTAIRTTERIVHAVGNVQKIINQY